MSEAENFHGFLMPDPMALRCPKCHHILYVDPEEMETDLLDRPLGVHLRKAEYRLARCRCESPKTVLRVSLVVVGEPDLDRLIEIYGRIVEESRI